MRRKRFALGFACALVAAQPAMGATITGSARADALNGTQSADAIRGHGGNDRLAGRAGADFLEGGGGRDLVDGGAGADRIGVHLDGARDDVRCGAGRDVVVAERIDRVAADCEVLSLQLSRDATVNPQSQHETQVEPDSFSFGSTIVTLFQSGRNESGGAAAHAWATSTDAGVTWRSGLLPGLVDETPGGGPFGAVSDPVVAYDALHRVWLASSLAVETSNVLTINRSPDGRAWEAPVIAAADAAEHYDKQWLACDNGRTSRFRGRCYLAYYDVEANRIAVRRSTDGGRTWSTAVPTPADGTLGSSVNGAYPIIRPDGSLVLAFTISSLFTASDLNEIGVVRSVDGGLTFTGPVRLGRFPEDAFTGVRAPPLVTGDVDARGRVYVAWSDCRFRDDCIGSDIVLARSENGVNWAAPVRVTAGDVLSDVDHFLPGLAVDPASSGATARVALVLHTLPEPEGCALGDCPGVDVRLIRSSDGGRTWGRPQILSVERMPIGWIASTGLGRMLGDYVSTSWAGGRPVPVFSLAAAPVGGSYRQAIFATVRGGP